MNPRGSVLACAVLLMFSAGFLLAVCTDGSEGANEHFTAVRVGDDVTVTGYGTLWWDDGWDGLKTLTVVPEGGEVIIGYCAFYDRDTLETVTIRGSVGAIEKYAFEDCYALKTVTIDGSVGPIGESAFFLCDCLSSFTVHGSVEAIGEFAFQYIDALVAVTIDGSVGSIGTSAFESCDALSAVTITGPITSIGEKAFRSCDNLKTVNIACNDPLNITKGSEDHGFIACYADTVNHVHRYSAAYDWADDGKTCTVHINCLNDSALISDEHPQVDSTVKIPPTETEKGTTEYSVSGTYDGYAYSDVKDVQDIPATGGGSGEDNVLLYAAVAAIAVIGALAVCYLLFLRGRKTE